MIKDNRRKDITEVINNLGKGLTIEIALAHAPAEVQEIIRAVVDERSKSKHEVAQASALGVTVEQFRIINSLPVDWIDWSKIGNKVQNNE